jgi:hypothetical protein
VAGYKDTGFGSYAKTAAGYQFQLDLASLAARKDLAAQMQARVSAGVKNAIKTVGAPGTPFEMVDQLASSVASQLTEAKLTGSKVVRSATDSKGTLWVVVGMDIQGARQTVQEAVMTSMKTEPAKWQGVSGKRLPSEMQAEVLKMTDAS